MGRSREIRDLDMLRRNVRGLYDVSTRCSHRDVAANSEFYRCNGVIFSSFSFTPLHFDHNPNELKEFNTDFLLLERYLSGEAIGVVGESVASISAKTLHVVDWSRRYKYMTTQVVGQSMMIPHNRVGYDSSSCSTYLSLKTESVEARLLGMMFDQFCMAMQKGKAQAASLCAELCTKVVGRLTCGHGKKDKDDLMSRVDAAHARSHIQCNLSDPKLGPEKLCKELSISRASLYRLFAEEGGVSRYIDRLRLQRCFDELLDARGQRGEVRRIAEAWGFDEPTLFNRKFRRQFNMSPSDCLATERPQLSVDMDIPEVWPINGWLRKA